MYKRSIGGWAKHWDFILLDTVCLQAAYILAFSLRFSFLRFAYAESMYRNVGLLLGAFSLIIAIVGNTMHSVLTRGIWAELRQTIFQSVLVFAAIVVFLFTSKDSDQISRIILYTTLGIYIVLAFVTRVLYKHLLLKHKKQSQKRKLLLIGDTAGIHNALTAFEAHPEESIHVIGLVLLDADTTEFEGKPVVASEKDAGNYIRNEWIDEIYLAVANPTLIPYELIAQCNEMAITVHQQFITTAEIRGRQWVEKIAKQPVLTTSISIPRPRHLIIKRIVDIIAGFFMSILALLVLLVITPIIKIKSPGPVLLKTERIGQNGKKFKIYSIRTMYMDAEKRLREWREKHTDESLTLSTDPRFIGNVNGKTGIGVQIRRWSLDDLPKGFNILFGQMSLVGTRAPSVEEWERYDFRHRARLACKPGLTGLWQASGRSKTMSFEDATKLDTEYITNWSLGLDWKILFKTSTLTNN